MSHPEPGLVAHHFADLEQQRSAHTLGIWLFLASEVLFFGGLFTAYTAMRYSHPEAFTRASQRLDQYLRGTYRRYSGDLVALGKGEILQMADD